MAHRLPKDRMWLGAEIYFLAESLETKFLNLSQSERLIDLFISRAEDECSSVLHDNTTIESLKK